MLEAVRELKRLGVGVFFVVQNLNTLTASGELMLTVHSAFAQAESEKDGALVRWGLHRKFEKGEPLPKTLSTLGYRKGPGETIEIDEEKAATVRLIFDLAGKGIWPTKIRDYLNVCGIPAPEGGKWNRTGIVRVLRNPMYKGDLLLQKWYIDDVRRRHENRGEVEQFLLEGNHPAIVTEEQWQKAQAMLRMRSEQTKPKEHCSQPRRSSHSRYALSGLLFCPRCGGLLIHKTGKCGSYWACRTNVKVSAAACKGIWLPESETADWDIHEPVVPVKYRDMYGMTRFTAYPLEEYEKEDAAE